MKENYEEQVEELEDTIAAIKDKVSYAYNHLLSPAPRRSYASNHLLPPALTCSRMQLHFQPPAPTCSQMLSDAVTLPTSGGLIPIISYSIFNFDSRGRSTVKPQIKLGTLSDYHEFSE